MVFSGRPAVRKLLACLAVVALMAACGGGEEPSAEDSPAQNNAPTSEMGDALLAAGDLPPGWELLNPGSQSSEVGEGESGFCGTPVPGTEGSTGSADVQFSKGEVTTRLVENVVRYFSVEQATAAFDRVEQAVQNCKEWDVEADDTVTTFTLAPAPFPNLADETVAVKVNGEFTVSGEAADGGPPTDGFVTGDTVAVRQQSTIIVIRHFAIGLGTRPTLATAETEPISRRAVEKVMQAAAP
ncbi:MAG TPA: hypothetical protein VHJ78_02750 [Actinomycetota bacterium]|nr:hypothetical protein [Actinomycetota bacterium]